MESMLTADSRNAVSRADDRPVRKLALRVRLALSLSLLLLLPR